MELSVRAGRVVGVLGPNGAGKSTLIDAITGFAPSDDGTVLLRDGRWTARRRTSAPAPD
ncbi:ATP-binding cassette domain-containing protein [Streptomyces sp. M19]